MARVLQQIQISAERQNEASRRCRCAPIRKEGIGTVNANVTLETADTKQFWEGAKRGKLLFQACAHCHTVQFPPRQHCASCWAATVEWKESAGKGVVESFTIVRRAPTQEFRAKVPYVVVAVQLDEGFRMITNLLGEDALGISIGDTVRVDFETKDNGTTLPQFRRM
jgi:uncharacterized OB-fold protein